MAYQLKRGRTIESRRELYSDLGRKFDKWMEMRNDELLKEVQSIFSIATDADRDQCLKFLVMDHVEKMIGDK